MALFFSVCFYSIRPTLWHTPKNVLIKNYLVELEAESFQHLFRLDDRLAEVPEIILFCNKNALMLTTKT